VTAALAFITIGLDPVLHLGPLPIHWYGVMYAVAFVAAFRFGVWPHVRDRGVPKEVVERITTVTIIAGLVGARLYWAMQNDFLYQLSHPLELIAVWHGGMAFFGAVFAVPLALLVQARRDHIPFWLCLDGGVLFAVFGQPIGRIGNIINGDILGPATTLPWGTAYTFRNPNGTCAVLQSGFQCGQPYQPAGFYEALGTLVILGILLLVRRRRPRDGVLGLVYFAAYPISQLILFQFRSSEPAIAFGLRQAQFTSLAVLLVLLPLMYLAWKRSPATGVPAEDTPAA
jgi:phosphatidylglycerol:prolipoprotein diacylglycerol transferase